MAKCHRCGCSEKWQFVALENNPRTPETTCRKCANFIDENDFEYKSSELKSSDYRW